MTETEIEKAKRYGFNRGWCSISDFGVPGGWQPGDPPQRLANHAIFRYLQRHHFDEPTERRDFTVGEWVKGRAELRAICAAAEFVEREKGTAQQFWRGPNDVIIVVLVDLVKTVLKRGVALRSGR